MKWRSIFISVLLGVSFISGCSKSPDIQSLDGDWKGVIYVNGTQLRLLFHFKRQFGSGLSATLDSLDQGVKGIAISVASAKPEAIKLEVASISGSFSGKMDSVGARIVGQWRQGPATLPLVLERTKNPERAEARIANPESVEVNQKTEGKLVGDWEGTLKTGKPLRLAFHLSKSSDGGLLGTFDSLDQNAKGIPISEIRFSASNIVFELSTIGGSFEAALQTDGSTLEGDWRQGKAVFPLHLAKAK